MITHEQLNQGEIFRTDVMTGVYSMECTKSGVCYLVSRDRSENGTVLFLVAYQQKDHMIIQFIHETHAPFIRIDFRDCKPCMEGDPTILTGIRGMTANRVRIYHNPTDQLHKCSPSAARMFKKGWRPS